MFISGVEQPMALGMPECAEQLRSRLAELSNSTEDGHAFIPLLIPAYKFVDKDNAEGGFYCRHSTFLVCCTYQSQRGELTHVQCILYCSWGCRNNQYPEAPESHFTTCLSHDIQHMSQGHSAPIPPPSQTQMKTHKHTPPSPNVGTHLS